jgi:hypothetical protein
MLTALNFNQLTNFLPKPFNFFRTKWFEEDDCKVEGLKHTAPSKAIPNGGPPGGLRWVDDMQFFVVVSTSRGLLRIKISKITHAYMHGCKTLKVVYQQGRWTKEMKGRIVH